MNRSPVELAVRAGGAVATLAGLHTATAGARSIPGHRGPASAVLESELRFFGVFYSAYGLSLWRAAPEAAQDPARLRRVAATLFAAGLARAGGWRAAGKPSAGQLGLLAVELLAPPGLVAWQRRDAGS